MGGGAETYDQVFDLDDTYDSWNSRFYSQFAERILDRRVPDLLRVMRVDVGASVLDAGCGTGVHSIRIARFGARPIGVDISATAIARAHAEAERLGLSDRVLFRQEDLRHLSFDDNSLSHIFSWGVIIHIRDVELALAEFHRVLKPGGTLGLSITNCNALDHKAERALRALTRRPAPLENLPLGKGAARWTGGELLWGWRFDIPRLIEWIESSLGLRLIFRHIGGLTGLQWVLPPRARDPLLLANYAAYRVHVPAAVGATNVLVLEKGA